MARPDKTEEELAAMIHRYWLERGHDTRVWVEGSWAERGVRSALVGGLPDGYSAVNGQTDLAMVTRASAATPAGGAAPVPIPHVVDRNKAPAVAATSKAEAVAAKWRRRLARGER
jgi:hypothetical protein